MLLIYIIMLTALLIISFIDIKEQQISGKALLLLGAGGIAAEIYSRDLEMLSGLASMLLVFIALGLASYISRGSIGMGDAKLCAAVALYLGIEKTFSMLVLAMLLCGITALVLITVDKTYCDKSLPFAPFVTAGTIAILLL